MVRNHQDGYPYINLSNFFVVVENIQKRQFFLEKLLVKEFRDRNGREIARNIKKKFISIFKLDKKW